MLGGSLDDGGADVSDELLGGGGTDEELGGTEDELAGTEELGGTDELGGTELELPAGELAGAEVVGAGALLLGGGGVPLGPVPPDGTGW